MRLWRNDINDVFKDKLKDGAIQPPEAVWERIEAELPPESNLLYWLRTWGWIAGVAVVTLAGILSTVNLSVFERASVLQEQDVVSALQRPTLPVSTRSSSAEPSLAAFLNEGNELSGNRRPEGSGIQKNYGQSRYKDAGQSDRSAHLYGGLDSHTGYRMNEMPENSNFHGSLDGVTPFGFDRLEASLTGSGVGEVPDLYFAQRMEGVSSLEEELLSSVGISEPGPAEELLQEKKRLNRDPGITTGFYIGPTAGIQTVWMLRNYIELGGEGVRADYETRFSGIYGFRTGYDFNTRLGVESGLSWSNDGYSIRRIGAGYSFTSDIDLYYLKLPLLFKYKNTTIAGFSSKPFVVNYVLGLEYGFLLKEDIPEEISDIVSFHNNKHQWGLLAGIGFDVYMHRHLYLTLGTQAGIHSDARKFPRFSNGGESPIIMSWEIYARFNFRSGKR